VTFTPEPSLLNFIGSIFNKEEAFSMDLSLGFFV
jgi:hypothetical protein